MTQSPRDDAHFVRYVFLIVLLTLVVPSKLISLAHGPDIARFSGGMISTLLVWWFLYRLCLRARPQAWFIAISIAALYAALWGPPAYAWGTLLALAIMYGCAVRYFPAPSPSDVVSEAIAYQGAGPESAIDAPATVTSTPSPYVIDLDRVCTPYRRILLSFRIIRAATASAFNSALLIGPFMFFWAIYDSAPVFGLVVGLVMMTLAGLVAAVFFRWLRALWRGSVTAGRIGAAVASLFAAFSAVAAIVTLDRELFVTGTIWFHLTAYALLVSLFAALAAGSAIVVRRQDDEALMSILRQNARHNWRDAVQHLSGIVLPRDLSLRAFAHKSVVLSIVAFSMEGAAFYVYFKIAENFLEAADLLRSPFSKQLTPLEGHYFSVVTIGALLLPVLYVSTQVTFTVAARVRSAARRASLRPAEDLLKEDRRPPVLFLRDFADDQVSLEKSALPGWVRVVDPAVEHLNLEDVMEAYATVGPVVAIGRPDDVAPPVGAARRYVHDGDWKSVVISMMDAAALIVIAVSESPGVLWEIDQVRDQGHLAKTVFVLPPKKRRNRELLCQLVTRLVPRVDQFASDIALAALVRGVGPRRVAGLIVHDGNLRVFVTDRRPSQIEFDVTLRLALAESIQGFRDSVRVPPRRSAE